MKKHLIISALSLLALASAASAQSYVFSTDLHLGSQGSDVANLQTFLIGNGFHILAIESGAQAKGYYGTQTASAVANFQVSVGISPTGYFGPQTRAWVNSHQSGGVVVAPPSGPIVSPSQPQQPVYPTNPTYPSNNASAPIITGTDAPSSLVVNQTATWTIHVFNSNPVNSNLNWTVNWGDGSTGGSCPNGYQCATSLPVAGQTNQQSSFSATHSYSTAGTYTVRFTVMNSAGYSAQSNTAVLVSNGTANGAGPLQITSPNGGEVWQRGTSRTITWTSPYYFAAAYATLQVTQTYNCTTQICPAIAYAPYTIATNIPINQNSYTWNVGSATNFNGQLATLPDGQYSVQICQTNSINSANSSSCDSSNGTFTITSSSVNNPVSQITVTSPNGGEVWQANSIHPITWNSLNLAYSGYNATAVDIYLTSAQIYNCPMIAYTSTVSSCGNAQSYTLDRNISASAQYNWVVGTDINNNTIPAGNYYVQVCPSDSTVNCDTSNSAFTISGTAYPYYPTTSTTNTSGYYTAPVYGTGTYNTGYTSGNACPAGYVCTPVSNTGSNYSY